MRRETNLRRSSAALIAAALLMLAASDCRGQATNLSLFWVDYYSQSGPSTITPTQSAFDARLFYSNAGDYASGTLNGPPGSATPLGLTAFPADLVLDSGNQFFGTAADRDSAFPNGTYSVTTAGGAPDVTVTATKTADAYSQSLAALTGATYTALQSLDPTQGFTFDLVPFVTNPAANEDDIFFNISDSMGNTVFSRGFLGSGTTQVFLPANTLLPGTDYTFSVIFSERINGTDPGSGVGTTLGFDVSTSGAFTTLTPVPEPASLALLGLGGVAAVVARRRGRRPISA